MRHRQPRHRAAPAVTAGNSEAYREVVQQVAVTDHHALWARGRARGVLEEREGCTIEAVVSRLMPPIGDLVGDDPPGAAGDTAIGPSGHEASARGEHRGWRRHRGDRSESFEPTRRRPAGGGSAGTAITPA